METDWQQWAGFFERRSKRSTQAINLNEMYATLPDSLAESLAIFQLGESDGGTIIEEARQSQIDAIDDHYADAMALFVAEEHRHADILACCVWALGGKLISKNWTATLFVGARRLIGLRLKVLVLLAAEVVGICYYHLLASRLPECDVKANLEELVADELSHLQFHCDFLKTQTRTRLRRSIFIVAWRTTMFAAAIAVIIDHRQALRDLDIGIWEVWRRWMDVSRQAEQLVKSQPNNSSWRAEIFGHKSATSGKSS